MIAAGHPPASVWGYTPREIAGWLFFAGKRKAREAGEQLSLGAAAARGEPRALKKQIKELTKD